MDRSEQRTYLRGVLGTDTGDDLATAARLNIFLEQAHAGLIAEAKMIAPSYFATRVVLEADSNLVRDYTLASQATAITDFAEALSVYISDLGTAYDKFTGGSGKSITVITPDKGFGGYTKNTTGDASLNGTGSLRVTTQGTTFRSTSDVDEQSGYDYFVDIAAVALQTAGSDPGLLLHMNAAGSLDGAIFVGIRVYFDITNATTTAIDIEFVNDAGALLSNTVVNATFAWTNGDSVRLGVTLNADGDIFTIWTEPSGGGIRTVQGEVGIDAGFTIDSSHLRWGASVNSNQTLDNLSLQGSSFAAQGTELVYVPTEDLAKAIGDFYTIEGEDAEVVIKTSTGIAKGTALEVQYVAWPDDFTSDIDPDGIPTKFHELIPLEALFVFELGNEADVPPFMAKRWQQRRQAYFAHIANRSHQATKASSDLSTRGGGRSYLRALLGVREDDATFTNPRLNLVLRAAHKSLVVDALRANPSYFQATSTPVATASVVTLPTESKVLELRLETATGAELTLVPRNELTNYTGGNYASIYRDSTDVPVVEVAPSTAVTNVFVRYASMPADFDTEDVAPKGIPSEYYELIPLEAAFIFNMGGAGEGGKGRLPGEIKERWVRLRKAYLERVQNLHAKATALSSIGTMGGVREAVRTLTATEGLSDPQLNQLIEIAYRSIVQDIQDASPDWFSATVTLTADAATRAYDFSNQTAELRDLAKILVLREKNRDGSELANVRTERLESVNRAYSLVSSRTENYADGREALILTVSDDVALAVDLWMKYTYWPSLDLSTEALTDALIPGIPLEFTDVVALATAVLIPGASRRLSAGAQEQAIDRRAQLIQRVGRASTSPTRVRLTENSQNESLVGRT